MILIIPRHELSYIWSWFFPVTVLHIWSWFLYIRQWRGRIRIIYKTVTGKNQDHIYTTVTGNTVLYMILILPRHCLIYDPDLSTSLSYIWSWFFPVIHCLIYDPDFSTSLSYIWSWFFPVAVLYMILILRQWRGQIRIIYKTVTGKNKDHI
jgi:hypothetical protein